MIIETKTPNGWEHRLPEVGETFRRSYPSGHVGIAIFQGNHSSNAVENLIPINFTAVEGATSHAQDFSRITGKVGATLTIKGTINIPDKTFITPIEKENIATGERTTEYVNTAVVDGEFSISLDLSGGKYRVTQELMNAELPQPMFELPTIEIYITI
ncbi:hypothetical protein ABXV22_25910 [Vibrio rotiferianus]|uniref:hypothetical protein n=1 Tax=Vibrio rotiferianus TaxID=190895 RepID=UPI0033943478